MPRNSRLPSLAAQFNRFARLFHQRPTHGGREPRRSRGTSRNEAIDVPRGRLINSLFRPRRRRSATASPRKRAFPVLLLLLGGDDGGATRAARRHDRATRPGAADYRGMAMRADASCDVGRPGWCASIDGAHALAGSRRGVGRMVRKRETYPPATMGHIRGHGCRDLLFYCSGPGRVWPDRARR
jgi:hypothetical protein